MCSTSQAAELEEEKEEEEVVVEVMVEEDQTQEWGHKSADLIILAQECSDLTHA